MHNLPERVRAFIAIRLGSAVESAVFNFIEPFRALRSGVHWVRPAQLHVTLRFLGGDVPREMLKPLDRELNKVVETFSAFTVSAQGTGAFPDLKRPRVVWIGLSSDALIALAARIEASACACGFSPDPRPFAPHLTIGRVRDIRGWPAVKQHLIEAADRDFGSSQIVALVLYRSILGPQSSRYEEISSYPFESPR
jgi:2'-5' RNA ligase